MSYYPLDSTYYGSNFQLFFTVYGGLTATTPAISLVDNHYNLRGNQEFYEYLKIYDLYKVQGCKVEIMPCAAYSENVPLLSQGTMAVIPDVGIAPATDYTDN